MTSNPETPRLAAPGGRGPRNGVPRLLRARRLGPRTRQDHSRTGGDEPGPRARQDRRRTGGNKAGPRQRPAPAAGAQDPQVETQALSVHLTPRYLFQTHSLRRGRPGGSRPAAATSGAPITLTDADCAHITSSLRTVEELEDFLDELDLRTRKKVWPHEKRQLDVVQTSLAKKNGKLVTQLVHEGRATLHVCSYRRRRTGCLRSINFKTRTFNYM